MKVLRVKRRFTVDEYHRMLESGILGEDDRVELLEGEIVQMSPIGSQHASCVKRLSELFFRKLAGKVIVGVQDPVRLNDYSEPQPDLALLRRREDYYAAAHPTPPDILLVVEVAETSVEADREEKFPHYSKAGVVEAWLIDLEAQRVEVFREPREEGYEFVRVARRGDEVKLLAFPEVQFCVEELLG